MKTMKQTDSKANSARKQTTSHSARKHIDNLTQSGHVITILDDYSSSATGEYITLDFSNIAAFSPAIAEEAAAVIKSKYEARAASPSYFKIMIPAIEKFSEYAKTAGVKSFTEYSEKDFMEFLEREYGEQFGQKYLRFCWCVASMMKLDLGEMRKMGMRQ